MEVVKIFFCQCFVFFFLGGGRLCKWICSTVFTSKSVWDWTWWRDQEVIFDKNAILALHPCLAMSDLTFVIFPKLQTGLPLFRPMRASSVQCRHWRRHLKKASFASHSFYHTRVLKNTWKQVVHPKRSFKSKSKSRDHRMEKSRMHTLPWTKKTDHPQDSWREEQWSILWYHAWSRAISQGKVIRPEKRCIRLEKQASHHIHLTTPECSKKTWKQVVCPKRSFKAGPLLDLSFWSFLTFLHHGIEKVEGHLLWKFHKKN